MAPARADRPTRKPKPLEWFRDPCGPDRVADTPFGRMRIERDRCGFFDPLGEYHLVHGKAPFERRYPTYEDLEAAAYANYVDLLASAYLDGIEAPAAAETPGFDCERDDGTFTVTWPDGRWLVVGEDGTLVHGSSPRRDGFPAIRTNLGALRAATTDGAAR